MRLLTLAQYDQLIKNGAYVENFRALHPVVKISIPGNIFTWLLTAIDPEDNNIGYGLYKEFDRFSIYGSIDFNELLVFKNDAGLGIEVDLNFKAKFPLSVYKAAEWWHGNLIEDEEILKCFQIDPVGNQLSLF